MTVYTLNVSKNDRNKCLDFSKKIIQTQNQYNRFDKTLYTQIERTFIGKLAEYLFYKFLIEKGINYPVGDMFEIFEGQTNVDSFDFKTKNGETVDIKTASKSFHKRIMVPISQWKLEKDYYVGIKIETNIEINSNKIKIDSINEAILYGYCTRSQIGKSIIMSFGEGPCKHYLLDKLDDIDIILDKF
jgi:hypothetical protein